MFCFLVIIFDEKEDDKESTDVFDDTIEILQRISPPTGVYTAECSSCECYAKDLRQHMYIFCKISQLMKL